MFERVKKWFKKEPIMTTKKKVIVCIHGFGTTQSKEFDNFMNLGTALNLHTFDIYALASGQDYRPEVWIQRCEGVVSSFLQAGYEVDVVGFSMGGVLAAHVAAKYDIRRLFLIAPAFDYISVGNVVSKAKELLTKKELDHQGKNPMPLKYTQCFMDVIRLCKESVAQIHCPVCFVHGDKDSVIPTRSSINAFEKVKHKQKRLFILHNGTHHLMSDKDSANEVFLLFSAFMSERLLPSVNNATTSQSTTSI